MKKEKIIECEECVKYSDYFKKGYCKRQMILVGDISENKKLYQCPNIECNKIKII